MATTKKRKKNLIVSYKNLPDDLKELFKETYPEGYNNYLQKFIKPNGEPIFVVPLETEDTSYMVKFEVKIDTLGEDLDKALFDEDDEETKEDEFAPLSEALEKEEADPSHKERVLRHGDFEDNLEEDEKRKKKLTLGINKEEIRAAFGDDDVEELDSYEKIDDDEPNDDDFEPTDEDLRGIEEEYLDAEIPPLDATIPEEEAVPLKKTSKKTPAKKATAKDAPAKKTSSKSAKSSATKKTTKKTK
jgi:hypothetical protein